MGAAYPPKDDFRASRTKRRHPRRGVSNDSADSADSMKWKARQGGEDGRSSRSDPLPACSRPAPDPLPGDASEELSPTSV